ncbi:HEAT repeat domain-containing protein [Sphingomonas sp. Sphisp140]|uniref:HEAT repeat domain-containing protein n=1 Tax=unclassified Sphingomonas TaxID=196159 RepID=UPI0039B02E9C
MDIKLIRAFIASPGGLEEERRAAFAAAKEVNKSVAMPMGGRLELIGWEDTLSGNGRPQATINAEMETCDLFIGAIWSSWGSRPSIGGPYTSGFEEEFELSRERHARTGSPLMAMFFKSVEANQMRDPGQDLQKVLAFQEKLKTEKSFLYGTFGQVEEFAAKVREFLSTHVINILHQPTAAQEERLIIKERQPSEVDPVPADVGEGDFPDAKFLSAAATGLQTEIGLGSLDIARLRLIASAYAGSNNDKQSLGVHDANLIYAARKQSDLSIMEMFGLLESGLGHLRDQNVPIWTWLTELNEGRGGLLINISRFSAPAEAAGAIEAMRLLQVSIGESESGEEDLVEGEWLGQGKPIEVKIAALRYLRDLGGARELPCVEREIDRSDRETLTQAIETAVKMLLRSSGQDAIKFVLRRSFETLDVDVLSEVLSHLSLISVQELEAGLDHRSAEVRAAVLGELSERDAVDMATLERAQSDVAPIVRYAALRALDRMGQSPSLDEAEKILGKAKPGWGVFGLIGSQDTAGLALFDAYAADRMRSMSQASLEALLGSPSHRAVAYRTLAARRIAEYPAMLRADLADGFEKYVATNWPDGIKLPAGAAGLLSLRIGNSDPVKAKERELTTKALDVIARKLDRNDLSLIRSVLDNREIGPSSSVIAYFKAFSEFEDIPRIARTPLSRINAVDRGDYYADFIEAARIILKLNRRTSAELLAFEIPAYMKGKIIEVMTAKDFASMKDTEIVDLLLSEDSEIRRQTAKKVPMSVTRTRVSRILNAYRSDSGGKYYIVTHWLDLGLAYDRATARRVASAER